MTSKPRESWGEDDERNRALYRSLLKEHGHSPLSLNWSRAEVQFTRFAVITQFGIASDASVLDVGCGLGDFRTFLRKQGHRGAYRGIDLTPEMTAAAQAAHPGDTFETTNLMMMPPQEADRLASDIVVASGIFYYRLDEPQHFMHAMIARLYRLARKGFAFNSLSAWADDPAKDGEFRADPIETLKYCRELTPWCALRHDYHPADFTIFMRRSPFAHRDSV